MVKFSLSTQGRHIWKAEVYLHSFLTLALDGGAWLTSHPGHFTPRKESWCPCVWGWVGPRPSVEKK
jgi:hypothetical protein